MPPEADHRRWLIIGQYVDRRAGWCQREAAPNALKEPAANLCQM